MTDQELAIAVHNPFEDFVKVPIQSTTGFQLGRDHKAGESLNVEPLVPFSLNANWDLFARPSLTFTYAPTPHEQSGLEDFETSFFLTRHNTATWIWGVGPIFDFPAASSSELGSGRWSAGPTAALVYSEGPWLNAILTDQLVSFAGNRKRGSVNQTYIEPMISYNLESGWYADCRSRDHLRLDRGYRQRVDYSDGRRCRKGLQYRLPEFESAGRRVRPCKASGRRTAMDNARERNVPLSDGH